MQKTFILFLLLSCFTKTAYTQINPFADSLLVLLEKEKDDTLRIKLIDKISRSYSESNPAKSIEYARTGLALSIKTNFKKGISQFYLTIGNCLTYLGEYEKALPLLDSAVTIFQLTGNNKGLSLGWNAIANIHKVKGDYIKATEYYFKSLRLAEEKKDSASQGMANFNIGGIYLAQNNTTKALDYHEKSLIFFTAQKDLEKQAIALSAIGGDYVSIKEYDKAIKYFEQAKDISLTTGNNRQLAFVYDYLADLNSKKGDYEKALQYSFQASPIWKELVPNGQNAIVNKGNIGGAYLDLAINDSLTQKRHPGDASYSKKQLLESAARYLKETVNMSQSINDLYYESFYGLILSDVYELQSDYKNAHALYKKYKAVDDSLHSQDIKNQIAQLESEKELSLRDKKLEINNLTIANQKKQKIALVTGIGLLAIIGGLLFWQSRTRKKTNTTLLQLNSELDEANKVKAKFFAILSHDLRSPVANLVNFLHLQKESPDLLDQQQTAHHQQRITQSAESLLETMESMLLWSKGQMEQFKPSSTDIPVSNLFDHIRNSFSEVTNVRFSFQSPDNLSVTTDMNYLQTIMQNLTGNAISALKETPDASIVWKAWTVDGNTYLSITDNGPGATEEQVKPLYDDSIVPNSRHGLGLHIIRDLAKAIKCSISVQQQEKGTTFLLSL